MPEDAIDEEEMASTAIPNQPSLNHPKTPPPIRNAFTSLMSPKRQPTTNPPTPPTFHGRNGLGAYITSPTSFPPSRVISHSEDFVTIHDLYPKSSIHILLLPRHASKTLLHPFTALSSPTFLLAIKTEVQKLRTLVAKDLQRQYGQFSTLEKARQEALETSPPPQNLPMGRDWEKEVISGVHSVPSMNNLHIHILSKDRISESMRHRKHYNSFNTGFLVPVEEFPLAENDPRRHPGREGYLHEDMTCWRCGKNFKNRFKSLKGHLEEEFEAWKRE
ncbi:MAG: hypothetical protein M1812_005400 [Candelaria pacifica]|nr:MAG: hypothetical protein M1812_005400 [Candelaria pacifica]